MKKLSFILYLLPWFLSSFLVDTNFYNSLNLPFFAIKPIVFTIAWTIIYILIALSIYYNEKSREYIKILLINYVFNQLYLFCFFTLRSPFLGFLDTLGILVTTLLLYLEIDRKKLLIPYIIFDIYAVILSLTIYFMNL